MKCLFGKGRNDKQRTEQNRTTATTSKMSDLYELLMNYELPPLPQVPQDPYDDEPEECCWECEECGERKEDEEDKLCYDCYGWITCPCGQRFCDPEEDECFSCNKPYRVYQVRVRDKGDNYNTRFLNNDFGRWEWDTAEEAFPVFLKYEKEGDNEEVVLTETPIQSEDECERRGKTYEIKEIAKK